MENIFHPTYRLDYFEGYSCGFNPYLQFDDTQYSPAFKSGFAMGRLEYERLNGCIISGIPLRVITNKVLEEFLLAGILGMKIDSVGYTPYQIEILDKWYQSGIEKYDAKQSEYLLDILEECGIEIAD